MSHFLVVFHYLTIFIAQGITLAIYAHRKRYVGMHFLQQTKHSVLKTKHFCTNPIFQSGEMLILEGGIVKRETVPWWNQRLERLVVR